MPFPLLHTAMTALTEEVARTLTPPTTTQQSNWTVNKTEGIFSAPFCMSSDFLLLTFERNLDGDKATLEIKNICIYYQTIFYQDAIKWK